MMGGLFIFDFISVLLSFIAVVVSSLSLLHVRNESRSQLNQAINEESLKLLSSIIYCFAQIQILAKSDADEKSKIKSMSFKPFLKYNIQRNDEKFSKIKVAITEGKNRELRRFFAHFGLDVLDLKRFEFGGISLNNLPTGKSRYLTREEYRNLRHFVNSEINGFSE